VTFGLGNRCSILLSYGTGADRAERELFITKDANEKLRGPRRGGRGAFVLPQCALAPSLLAPSLLARPLLAVVALALVAFVASAPVLADPCRPARLAPVELASLGSGFDLALADGRSLRLAGVEHPSGLGADLAAEATADLALWASGALEAVVLRPQTDRWGRMLARVFVSAGAAGADLPSLSEALVDAGFARVDPLTERRPCLDALYGAEARARKAGRGLWSRPEHAVIDAADPASFKGRSGMVIVEGVVASVGEWRGLVFVNLGADPPRAPAIVIGRSVGRELARQGRAPASLEGRRVRARGILDLRRGTRVEILDPGALELIANAASGGPGGP